MRYRHERLQGLHFHEGGTAEQRGSDPDGRAHISHKMTSCRTAYRHMRGAMDAAQKRPVPCGQVRTRTDSRVNYAGSCTGMVTTFRGKNSVKLCDSVAILANARHWPTGKA